MYVTGLETPEMVERLAQLAAEKLTTTPEGTPGGDDDEKGASKSASRCKVGVSFTYTDGIVQVKKADAAMPVNVVVTDEDAKKDDDGDDDGEPGYVGSRTICL